MVHIKFGPLTVCGIRADNFSQFVVSILHDSQHSKDRSKWTNKLSCWAGVEGPQISVARCMFPVHYTQDR